MEGKLIVIDGSDGSGKATQSQLLLKYLEEKGKKAIIFDFPRYNEFFGKMVGEYLNNKFGKATEVNPYLASLIYAGDRWSASKEMKEYLSDGYIVICNRYVVSNLAHQGGKTEDPEFTKWEKELEYNVYKIPKPDKVIILSFPVEVAQELVDSKTEREYTDKKRDGHEEDANYLEQVTKAYKEIAVSEGYDLIDCYDGGVLSKEEIHNKIITLLSDVV